MISMGKSGGVYGSGNTGLPQAFSGGKKTQNNQKSIFGAKNKSSVTDIRRMLSRNSQSTQTQAANSWGQDSIVTSTLSYSESLRNQRQQTKNTTLALKKLKYQFKSISSKILRSKTSQAAKQAAGQARREIMRLKRQKQNSDSDSDSEEIDAAIAHAQAMERVAKKKAKHLEEEEMMKAAAESVRETGSAKKKRRMRRMQKRKMCRMRKKCQGISPHMSMQAMRRMQGIAMIYPIMLISAWMHSMRRQETLCRK